MSRYFASCVFALTCFVVNSLAQSESNLEKLEIKNLNLGFCSEPCIAGHTKDLDLLLLIIKTTASSAASLEFDAGKARIVYSDAAAIIENLKTIVKQIDRSARGPRKDPACDGERPAAVFISPVENRSN